MTDKEVFDAIRSDIKKYEAQGKIIKILNGNDTPSIISIDNLLNQPIEGLLYDLDLDEATLATIYKDKPLKYADMKAIVNVISFLYNAYIANKTEKE